MHDNAKYPKQGNMPAEVARNIVVNWSHSTYEPIIYMSDFWHLKKDYIPLNESLNG